MISQPVYQEFDKQDNNKEHLFFSVDTCTPTDNILALHNKVYHLHFGC